MDKKRSLNWFLHKRFITIGIILGILIVLYDAAIIKMAFVIRNSYQAAGSNSMDWIAIAGLIFGLVGIATIVVLDLILNKMALAVIDRVNVPLNDISESIQDLSQGNLDTSISYSERDEFAMIVDSTANTIVELKKYINNISETLTQMSDKNMNLSVDIDYVGDFQPIKGSIEAIIDSLNSLLGGMKESMDVIRMGAKNMAETASSLAEGATTQSSEIQDLFAHINQVTQDMWRMQRMQKKWLHWQRNPQRLWKKGISRWFNC